MTSLNALTPRSRLISLFAGYPEHMAVVNDDIAALDAALAADDGDCDVELHRRGGDTPLMLAIRLHRTRIVEHLIAVGANVNFHEIGLFAARFGNQRIMETLLQAGIDLGMLFGYESNVYHYAARNSDAGVLRALVAAGEFDEPNAECTEPIHFAAENENEEIMSILLAAGSYVEYSPELAMRAARNRNHKVLAMLMEAGVDINVMDSDGSFLIHRAARNPNVAVVRLSIDAGVDLNVLDCDGETTLFGACTNSNMEVLDALLAAGAEWREVGTKRTICHAVARNTNEAIVRRVIARGVDVNARDSYADDRRRIEHCAGGGHLS